MGYKHHMETIIDSLQKFAKNEKTDLVLLKNHLEQVLSDVAFEIKNDDEHEIIECSECGELKPVEKGTWALDKGMCEPCYCLYQGG